MAGGIRRIPAPLPAGSEAPWRGASDREIRNPGGRRAGQEPEIVRDRRPGERGWTESSVGHGGVGRRGTTRFYPRSSRGNASSRRRGGLRSTNRSEVPSTPARTRDRSGALGSDRWPADRRPRSPFAGRTRWSSFATRCRRGTESSRPPHIPPSVAPDRTRLNPSEGSARVGIPPDRAPGRPPREGRRSVVPPGSWAADRRRARARPYRARIRLFFA